ncbi:MAG: nucleotide-binding protein, partial [Gammaproteobacteria bacterium]|nr:nucleotide-binding protein [Gammaproteobacteria bacterium]
EFESKSLNRTFDVVYFAGALENLSAPALPEGRTGSALPAGHPSFDGTVETKAADTKVPELEPGQNIAYVYANKDALTDQRISLRGKVVKYNEGILGKNFIHIQDGSGDAADGSNDLTVTSEATTAVGETVVLTGTIILNKDFGAGYSFPVMMEDAGITTE